jgi:transcription elongation factor S-II
MEELRIKSIDVLRGFVEDEEKCHHIEESIYNFCNKYVKNNSVEEIVEEIYTNKFDDILSNLDKTKLDNNYLLNAVLSGDIDANNIADLSPQGLFPNKWKKIIDRKNLIEDKKNNMATTNIFTCRKCNKKKCSVYQMQTRCADEPMTTFVNCLMCGAAWKF